MSSQSRLGESSAPWGKILVKYPSYDYKLLSHCYTGSSMPRIYFLSDAYASFNCCACSGVSIPNVVHTSISIFLTSRTILRILSNPLFLPERSRQAAPMQNRVLPFSLALRAASRTGSISSNLDAFVGVEYRDDWEQ